MKIFSKRNTSNTKSYRIALRYPFTGDAQTAIAASFRVSPSRTGRSIYETINVNWELAPEYLPCPLSEAEWKDIFNGFESRWQFIVWVL